MADHDPLQDCVERRDDPPSCTTTGWCGGFPHLMTSAGFRNDHFDSHGYAQTMAPDYMLTLVDRGADILINARWISGRF
jgi:hypothetical protein